MSTYRFVSIMLLVLGVTALMGSTVVAGIDDQETDLDTQLAGVLANAGVEPLVPGAPPSPELVVLGEALFWDPILSGNRDIACVSCHHPLFGTGDGLSLSYGTGATGVGPLREQNDAAIIARNAPAIFNRGDSHFTSMFWDSRVTRSAEHGFSSPAGDLLPPGLSSVLAVQAMFPVTSDDEMRGVPGDTDIYGNVNELALIDSADLPAIWAALVDRLLAIPAYQALFQAAYPNLALNQIGFQHAANAIAAYETATFSFYDSPWDRYLAGNTDALSDEAKRGALLFYGEARCGFCHSGPLLSDQLHHNVAVPLVGPGINDGLDSGRDLETGNPADQFAFRTPPLRNVAIIGPWMHNGAYTTLDAAVRHMLDPLDGWKSYRVDQIELDLQETVRVDDGLFAAMTATLDPVISTTGVLDETEFSYLMAFLYALTSPSALDLSHTMLETVPSELASTPVEAVANTSTDPSDDAAQPETDTRPPDNGRPPQQGQGQGQGQPGRPPQNNGEHPPRPGRPPQNNN